MGALADARTQVSGFYDRTVWTVGLARGRPTFQGAGQKKRISRFGNGSPNVERSNLRCEMVVCPKQSSPPRSSQTPRRSAVSRRDERSGLNERQSGSWAQHGWLTIRHRLLTTAPLTPKAFLPDSVLANRSDARRREPTPLSVARPAKFLPPAKAVSFPDVPTMCFPKNSHSRTH